MGDLDAMLGEDWLECCLGELADDQSPTQSEADAQNRKVMRARHRKQNVMRGHSRGRQNPELGKIDLGRAFTAMATGGVSEIVRGGSKALSKGKKVLDTVEEGAKVASDISSLFGGAGAAEACAKIAAEEKAKHSKAAKQIAQLLPAIKIRCIPCGGSQAVAGDVAKKIIPEMTRVRKLLDMMALQAKATSEHNAIKKQNAWRKQAIGLLKQVQEKRCNA
jgi:hypothetical protein